MTRPRVFGAYRPSDLMGWVQGNFAELEREPNERRLVNTIVLLNHFPDWVWKLWLEPEPTRFGTMVTMPVSGKKSEAGEVQLRKWVELQCPPAKWIYDLANGAKHLSSGRKPVELGEGGMTMDLGSLAFGVATHVLMPWWIDLPNGGGVTIYDPKDPEGAVQVVLGWWENFINDPTRSSW